ncbi:MAG: fumarylacetoacetate hydrolase family protein [Gammaproteobacteria bacterium]|nr:fumarylacetoacetate hydrolase family protein [Gammaproteobacteria bacterium]
MSPPSAHRIFCIGKNYAAHVAELAHLGHAPAGELVVFMKPASAIVPAGAPIPLPRGFGAVHHEAELVVSLGGFGDGGRDLAETEAVRYVKRITLGLDLTLRELQTQLKNKGAPWELAKAFDGAAPLGDWVDWHGGDLQAIHFTCRVNGEPRQRGDTSKMLFPVARQIHILSRTWKLIDGDVIFTGTPAGVGPLTPGDEIALESELIGRYAWRCV